MNSGGEKKYSAAGVVMQYFNLGVAVAGTINIAALRRKMALR